MSPHKKQLTDEIRVKIISKYEAGKSPVQISSDLDIKYETTRSVIKNYKRTGRIIRKKNRASKPKKITPCLENFIKDKISSDCSITLNSLAKCIANEKNIMVSKSTIFRAIKDFNYTLKRVVFIPEIRNSTRVIEERFEYANKYLLLNEEKVMFLDEFGVSCSTRCNYGRSECGLPARKVVRAIRSKNYSISAAITKNGAIYSKTLPCAYNGQSYALFLRELMDRMVNLKLFNYTIIMDNCSIHKVVGIREIIENEGHMLLLLPPYSPQLNAIEEFFSKWKGSIKARNSNNTQELENAILSGCSTVSIVDCNGFFRDVRRHALKAIRKENF